MEVCQFLVGKGAAVNPDLEITDVRHPVFAAASEGHLEVLRLLAENQAPVDVTVQGWARVVVFILLAGPSVVVLLWGGRLIRELCPLKPEICLGAKNLPAAGRIH